MTANASAASDAARWQATKRIFSEALDLPPAERDRFVATSCADDPSLLREVRELLHAHAIEDGFIERPAVDSLGWTLEDGVPDWTGRRIGPWQVVAEAGRGGLGRVFRAVRDDGEVEQQVAIKLLAAGVASDALFARFRTERRILARLNHPNIAHFLDGGATEEGIPYIVMEYVDGQPIDEYCEARNLDLEARLDLFRTLCGAVHHVHQNLLVHGDLKGSNVLVTADGVVKLLDFGIARLLDSTTGDTGRPATLMLMTPDYASPEQRRGESLTTASDVWSLGALLYRLTTGAPPTSAPGKTDSSRTLEPVAPSIASAVSGRVQSRFASALRGDLDTIILKALKHEPYERYGSAEQLGDDIHRYLRGFPVEAQPDSALYRARKFARRHAAASVATGLFVVALVGGIAASLWQAHAARLERERSERLFQTVRKLSNTFLGEVYDAITSIPSSTSARKLLLDNSFAYLAALERDAPDSPALRGDLGKAWERLGDVQGAYLQPSLGDMDRALESYRRSLAIRETLVRDDPTPQHRLDLLSIQIVLGEALIAADRIAEAGPVMADAVRNADAVIAAGDTGPALRRAGSAYITAGALELARGRGDAGIASLERARKVFEGIASAEPGNPKARRDVALVLGRIGEAHMLATGRFDEALAYYRRVRAQLDALTRDVPDDLEFQRARTFTIITIGQLHVKLGQPDDALNALEPQVEGLEQWRAADSADAFVPVVLGATLNLIGEARLQRREFAAASARFDEAARFLRPELADAVADYRVIYGQMLAGRALADANLARSTRGPIDAHRLALAQSTAQRAIAVLEPLDRYNNVRLEAGRLLGVAREALSIASTSKPTSARSITP